MLHDLFDPEGAFNQAHLVCLHSFSSTVCIAVILVAAAVLWMAWRNSQSLTLRRRLFLLALRTLTVLVLLALFLQPGVRLEQVSRMRDHVAVLIDHSRSMALPGEGKQSRFEEAIHTLKESDTLAKWRHEHQVDFFAFDRGLQPLPEQTLKALQEDGPLPKLTGEETDLQAALQSLDARFQPQDLAAVVVVSDGADNASLKGIEEATANLKALAGSLGAPIHTLFTGPKDPPKDVALLDVRHDSFAFVRNAVMIEAVVQVQGYEDLELPVTLYHGDQAIQSKLLRVVEGQSQYKFEFEFVPDLLGKSVFTLEIGLAPNESIPENNKRSFTLQTLRDKIRVLQVAGRPSWDERFLRKLLEENPNVDLISFFILRTNESINVSNNDDLSLIPFPTEELFHEQLGSFDLVIFQNFTFKGFSMRQYLPEIRDYVQQGGGFLMLGGDQSFASGGYSDTPLADLMPFTLPEVASTSQDSAHDVIDTARFHARLTESGHHHPITQISDKRGEALSAQWAAMPELSGINRTAGLKSDAIVLLEHPTLRSGGKPEPVMVVRNFGEGRVLAVTTDSSWHWAFHTFAQGGDSRAYYRLYGNAIRWLCRDPALRPIQVKADRDQYPVGAEVNVQATLTAEDGAPLADHEVTFQLFEYQGKSHMNAYDTAGDAPLFVQTLKTDAQGRAFMRTQAQKEGSFELVVEADLSSSDRVRDQDFYIVAPDPKELSDVRANRQVLEAVAKAGHGEIRTLDEGLDRLALKEAAVMRVNRRHDVPLWSHWLWLLLAILFPSLEWGFRRHYGLL